VAARRLLGARLVADDPELGRVAGRIVEVEAYIGETDQASHARFGRTARNGVMYGEPGLAYLYLVYGMHTCLNVVTEPAGRPAAVLIRAVHLESGTELARALRLRAERRTKRFRSNPTGLAAVERRLAATPVERVAAGPGLVGAAFGLDPAMTGLDLCDPGSRVRLMPGGLRRGETIRATARIGIDYAGSPWTDRPWRLLIAGDPAISGPRRLA